MADVPLQNLAARIPNPADELYDILVVRDLLHARAELLRSLERQGVMVPDTVPERLTGDAVNRYLALQTGAKIEPPPRAGRTMDLAKFIERQRPHWRRLEALLARIEGSGLGTLSEEEAVEFGRLYRGTASDLNQAQTFITGDTTVHYLNDLVARSYLVIYDRSKVGLSAGNLVRYLVWGYPAIFRRHLRAFLLATAICAVGTVFGFLVAYYDPAGQGFLLPDDFDMIKPGKSGQEEGAQAQTTGWLAGFSGFLFRHNVSVTLVAFALGMTFGIATAWLMFTTGIMMGALGAVFFQAGEFTAFCTGILPHGVLEIPSVLIGGAAGFVLAQGMIRARPWPRLDEMAQAGKEAILLVSGSVPLLAMAALLEAVVARAPNRYLSSGFKLAVAGVFGLLFVAYVLLLGWRKPVKPAEAPRATS